MGEVVTPSTPFIDRSFQDKYLMANNNKEILILFYGHFATFFHVCLWFYKMEFFEAVCRLQIKSYFFQDFTSGSI